MEAHERQKFQRLGPIELSILERMLQATLLESRCGTHLVIDDLIRDREALEMIRKDRLEQLERACKLVEATVLWTLPWFLLPTMRIVGVTLV